MTTELTDTGSYATVTQSTARRGNPYVGLIKNLAMIVVVCACAYVGYEIIINNKSFDEIISSLPKHAQVITGFFSDTPAGDSDDSPPLAEAEPEITDDQGDVADDIAEDLIAEDHSQDLGIITFSAGNPYLGLPNRLIGDIAPLARKWSPQEEAVWHRGITHSFPYQHYKTVRDVVRTRLAGSDVVLWDALDDDKLWVRMWAVCGLADFGIEIDGPSVTKAIGSARSDLIRNFFKRFIGKSTAGQRYVMRYALPVVAPSTRLVIYRALLSQRDDLNDLYLVAASLDPNRRLSRWAKNTLRRLYISQTEIDNYQRQITSSTFQ